MSTPRTTHSESGSKQIVCRYPVYAETMNYLGDLDVMTLAHALGITLLSMEVDACGAPSKKRPKIPSVFREFGLTASRSPVPAPRGEPPRPLAVAPLSCICPL